MAQGLLLARVFGATDFSKFRKELPRRVYQMLKGLDVCSPTSKGEVKRPLETAKEPSDAPESIPKRSGPTGATEVPTEGIKS